MLTSKFILLNKFNLILWGKLCFTLFIHTFITLLLCCSAVEFLHYYFVLFLVYMYIIYILMYFVYILLYFVHFNVFWIYFNVFWIYFNVFWMVAVWNIVNIFYSLFWIIFLNVYFSIIIVGSSLDQPTKYAKKKGKCPSKVCTCILTTYWPSEIHVY